MKLAFLNDLSFAILDLKNEQVNRVSDENSLIEKLQQRIAAHRGFDYYYFNNMLFIEIRDSDSTYAVFNYEDNGQHWLVRSLSLPDFIYLRKNVSFVRKLID
ncbi:hypothetical protein [Bacillus cereus group sp. BfR-BA-01358]|uniref:hypothetical protein n=1 Tax=Bacillus cereus group sp. BfR-BA-01358 TaxID=2920320 RepID=UPI001F594D64|nr:hypothetical protein [Bacillus cereus group sp. BfR-BA-01358]